jgi:hypothetical protein
MPADGYFFEVAESVRAPDLDGWAGAHVFGSDAVNAGRSLYERRPSKYSSYCVRNSPSRSCFFVSGICSPADVFKNPEKIGDIAQHVHRVRSQDTAVPTVHI